MVRGIEKGINLRDGHPFWPVRDFFDAVSRSDFAFLDYSKIKAWPMMRDQQRRHLGVIKSQPDFVAGNARLADFEDRTANPEPVADTDFIIREAFDREILAEITVNEIRSAKIFLPIAIGSGLIDHDGPLFSTVARKIGLSVPGQIESSNKDSAIYRLLPNRRSDGLSAPFHVLWQSDIDGDDSVHADLPRLGCNGPLF